MENQASPPSVCVLVPLYKYRKIKEYAMMIIFIFPFIHLTIQICNVEQKEEKNNIYFIFFYENIWKLHCVVMFEVRKLWPNFSSFFYVFVVVVFLVLCSGFEASL